MANPRNENFNCYGTAPASADIESHDFVENQAPENATFLQTEFFDSSVLLLANKLKGWPSRRPTIFGEPGTV